MACLVLTAYGCDCSSGTNLAGEQDADDVPDTPDAFDAPDEAPATEADDGMTEDMPELTEDTGDDADALECPSEPATGPGPVPFAPQNGTATGSPWGSLDALTLRPLFRWRWTPDGGSDPTFEIEVDDSCTTPGFAWCCFPSPEASVAGLTGSTWRPDTDLPIDRSPPVGRRYYWRVRACRTDGCSAWSDVRYLDVGRPFGDWNGDGYSDLVVGAPGWAHVFVYLGGASLDATADLTIVGAADDTTLGASVAYAGDVNADGFSDLLVGAPEAAAIGRAYLYLGSATPDTTADIVLRGEGSNGRFGAGLAGGGDVNGDGFTDFLVGEPGGGAGKAYLHLGGRVPDDAPDLVFQEGTFFDGLGAAVTLGDLNGDGFADMLVGAPGYDPDPRDYGVGCYCVYFGNALPDATQDLMMSGEEAGGRFGGALSAGDVNGDGYADLLVGALGVVAGGADARGHAFLFLGGAAPDVIADATADGTRGDHLGTAVAMDGDLDGDGFVDAALGAPGPSGRWGDPPPDVGRAFLSVGGPAADLASDGVLTNDVVGNNLGYALATRGDYNGDGRQDLLVGAPHVDSVVRGEVYLWLGRSSELPSGSADLAFSGTVPGDGFGSAVE